MITNRGNTNKRARWTGHWLMALACIIVLTATGATSLAAPASYDLRNVGGVTSVKDQGIAGACWSFATYGAIESHTIMTDGFNWPNPDFSENDLKNNHGFDMGHSAGGNIWVSAAHLSRLDGPILETDDPYDHLSGTSLSTGPRQRFLANMYTVGGPSKNSIMANGGMHVSLYWAPAYFNSTNDTYYYNGPSSVGTNHALTIVGWDDNKVTDSPNNGAWLAKDSKGTGTGSYGTNGYFWISYNDTVANSNGTWYETVGSDVVNVNKAYVHDYFGRVGVSNETDAANVFTTGDNVEDLVRVGIYTEGEGSYLLEVYNGNACEAGAGLPGVGPTPIASKTIPGTPKGYRTFDFSGNDITFLPNSTFTVMLHSLGAGGADVMAFDSAKPGYSSASTAGPGESYYLTDNMGWQDLYNLNWPNPEIQMNTSNWSIKAFTIPEPTTMLLLVVGGLALLRRRRK